MVPCFRGASAHLFVGNGCWRTPRQVKPILLVQDQHRTGRVPHLEAATRTYPFGIHASSEKTAESMFGRREDATNPVTTRGG